MASIRRLAVLGVGTFVLGAMLMIPARIVYDRFAPPAVTLAGLEGSIWSGSAADGRISGVYARDIRWRMRPLYLATGKLAFHFEASPSSSPVAGDVAITFGGDVIVSDLRGQVPLTALEDAIGIRGLAGSASVDISQLRLVDGVPASATGSVEVSGLVAPLPSPTPIGGYRAEFFTREDGINASVEDTDGVLDIAGQALLRPDRSYQFRGMIAPKPATPPQLASQLRFLGTPNERGQYELRLEGSL